MQYNNIPYYSDNMYRARQVQSFRPGPGFNNRFGGGFLLPFALGFVSSPLIFGATRTRPYYGPYYGPGYFPY